MNLLYITKIVVLCAIVSVVSVVVSCIWDQHKNIKNGWKKEDDGPWDDDDE